MLNRLRPLAMSDLVLKTDQDALYVVLFSFSDHENTLIVCCFWRKHNATLLSYESP